MRSVLEAGQKAGPAAASEREYCEVQLKCATMSPAESCNHQQRNFCDSVDATELESLVLRVMALEAEPIAAGYPEDVKSKETGHQTVETLASFGAAPAPVPGQAHRHER